MILRSLPMTDFSPLDGGVSDRCTLGARDCVLDSTELRVNMSSPHNSYGSAKGFMLAPSAFIAQFASM
jgi:hypothetical protein